MPAEGRVHVLIVEDEPLAAELIARYLVRKGCRVTEAKSGIDAFARFVADPADLVITDIRMPQGGGTELIQRLHAKNPGLPIMVVTGYCTAESEAELKSLGVSHIFEKPLRLDKLGQAIDDLKGKDA